MDLEILQPIGNPILGVIIPLIVFIVASLLTWWLYRHFSSQNK